MAEWFDALRRLDRLDLAETEAIDAYAHLHLGFVHIHPFWDGNGRLARLVGNLPLLRSGQLPVVIEVKDRKRYMETLAEYQSALEPPRPANGVWPRPELETGFAAFCRDPFGATRALVDQAHEQQAKRTR
jgi:Fic family protein